MLSSQYTTLHNTEFANRYGTLFFARTTAIERLHEAALLRKLDAFGGSDAADAKEKVCINIIDCDTIINCVRLCFYYVL